MNWCDECSFWFCVWCFVDRDIIIDEILIKIICLLWKSELLDVELKFLVLKVEKVFLYLYEIEFGLYWFFVFMKSDILLKFVFFCMCV